MLTRTRHRIAVVTVASAIALTGLPVTAHATTAHATTAPAETSVATAGGGPCVTDFTDAPPTGSYYTAITWMACEGITAGYANGSFGKTRQITRGQTAQFLYRMSGDRHDAGSKRDFADVNPGGAGFTAISWMEAKGYSAGYTDGRFGINDPISRGNWPRSCTGWPGRTRPRFRPRPRTET